jgi:hypothetical protein
MSRSKITIAVLAVLVITVAVAGVAQAGGWSFDWGLGSLIADGWAAGLGGGGDESYAMMTGYGTAYAQCRNQGGNTAPGRSPINAQVTAFDAFPVDENGRADIRLEATESMVFNPSPTPKEAGCPNGRWSVVGFGSYLDDGRFYPGVVDWYAADIQVYASNGTLKHDLHFTCDTYPAPGANQFNAGVTCTSTSK